MQVPFAELRDTRFASQRFARLGIELMRLSEFKSRTIATQRARPERVEFFMLWLTTSGTCRHSIDFVDFAVSDGSLVFAKPSQVQQWHVEADLEGWILLVEPTSLLPAQGHHVMLDMLLEFIEDWPSVIELDTQFSKEMNDHINTLRRDFHNYDESKLHDAVIQNAVLGVLLRLARWHSARLASSRSKNSNPVVFQLLRKALEETYRQQWSVGQYAKHLGYSESTLNRACEAAIGHSAKVMIDRRIALEAARLLIHTDASIVEIGHQMGFSESTNFVRFFARMNGATPARFRQEKLGSTL
jgi:AraC-like DNA-binding protein